MPFMPFQVLGIWLRALLAPALLALGVLLLVEWFNRREIVVREPLPEVRTAARPVDDLPAPGHEGDRVRVISWQFGFNRETAFLLGGMALALVARRLGRSAPEAATWER